MLDQLVDDDKFRLDFCFYQPIIRDAGSSHLPSVLFGAGNEKFPTLSLYAHHKKTFRKENNDLLTTSEMYHPVRRSNNGQHLTASTSPLKSAQTNMPGILSSLKNPLLVIIGQMLLLVLAWTFFRIIYTHKTVSLPLTTALSIQRNQQAVTLVVTLVATLIGSLATYLFSLSIKYAVDYYLSHRSLAIVTLGASIKIANGAFVLDTRVLKWTFIGIFLVLLTGSQTAGWSTLITPTNIVIKTPVYGKEIDITNDTFVEKYASSFTAVTRLSLFRTYLQMSGLTAASGKEDNASLFSFGKYSFVNSTDGIAPSELISISDNSTVLGLRPDGNVTLPAGFSSNLTVHSHQGYTANVSCMRLEQADLSPEVVQTSTFDEGSSLYQTSWLKKCSYDMDGMGSTVSYYSQSNVTLAGIACPMDNSTSQTTTTNFDFLLFGDQPPQFLKASQFSFVYNCTIFPQVTINRVVYEGSIHTISGEVEATAAANALSRGSMLIMQALFSNAQTLDRNMLLDGMIGVTRTRNITGGEVVATFIKGVLEYTATLLRDEYIQGDPALSPTYRDISGIVQTSTIGFSHRPTVSALALVLVNTISIASILIVVFVLIQKSRTKHNTGRNHPQSFALSTAQRPPASGSQLSQVSLNNSVAKVARRRPFFDAADPFHVLAVASAGGLAGAFGSDLDPEELNKSHSIRVRLDEVGEDDGDASKFGLVRC